MSLPLVIFYVLAGITGSLYVFFILMYTFGWYRLRRCSGKAEGDPPFITVIVPVRNEERTIGNVLSDLEKQSLSRNAFEVIVVDDHSSDQTVEKVSEFSQLHPQLNLRLIRLSDDQERVAFKKNAIASAIEAAKGNLIVTTDADCRSGTRWLETIASCYATTRSKMLVGPVSYHHEKTVFERMQTQEFLSLIGITGGAIAAGKPIMCNGANLAYEKEAYIQAGGFEKDRFSSGDDIFLMLKIRKLYGSRSINFLKDIDALVLTEPKNTLASFYQQRTRWASKNKGYSLNILVVSVTVYLFNLVIAAGLAGGLIVPGLLLPALMVLLAKTVLELPILTGITTFVGRTSVLLYTLPLAVMYPFYVVLVGAGGMFGRYTWKGRKIKN